MSREKADEGALRAQSLADRLAAAHERWADQTPQWAQPERELSDLITAACSALVTGNAARSDAPKLSPTGNSDSGSKEGLRPPAAGSLCGVCGRPNVQAGDDGCARLLTGDDEDLAADYTAECYAKGYEREKARADGVEREAAASRACITFDPPSDPAQIVARLRLIVENHNKQCGDFVTQRNSAWRRAIELGKAKKAAEARADAADKERRVALNDAETAQDWANKCERRADAAESALAEERRRVLEEAAQIADEHVSMGTDHWAWKAATLIRDRIRALIPGTAGESPPPSAFSVSPPAQGQGATKELPRAAALTEKEMQWARDRLPEIEARAEQSAKETPTDPCYCRRHLLKPSWAALTDPAWTVHRRTGCHLKDRPPNATDAEWAEIEEGRRAQPRRAPDSPPEGLG